MKRAAVPLVALPVGFVPDGFAPDPSGASPADRSAVARPDARQPNYNRTLGPDLARMGVNMLPPATMLATGAVGLGLGGPIGGGIGAVAGEKYGEHLRNVLAPYVGLDPRQIGLSPLDAITFLSGISGPLAESGAPAGARGLTHAALKPSTETLGKVPTLIEDVLARGERVGAPGAASRYSVARNAARGEVAGQRAGIREGTRRELTDLGLDLEQVSGRERAVASAESQRLIAADKNLYTLGDLSKDYIGSIERKHGPMSEKEKVKVMRDVWNAAGAIIHESSGGVRGIGAMRKASRFSPDFAFSAQDLDVIRQYASDAQRGAIKGLARGQARPVTNLEMSLSKRAGSLLKENIPGLEGMRQTESMKIGLRQAARSPGEVRRLAARGDMTASRSVSAEDATRRRASVESATLPVGPAQKEALVTRSLLSSANRRSLLEGGSHVPALSWALPRIQSKLGLLLNDPASAAWLRYAPLSAQAALMAMFDKLPPDSTSNK